MIFIVITRRFLRGRLEILVSSFSPKTVGVIGAGVMGTGIALSMALAGHRCFVFDNREGAAAESLARTRASIQQMREKGRLTPDAATQVSRNLLDAGVLQGMSECDLIVEAVIEDLPTKRSVFHSIEAVAADHALLATNTSSLLVSDIGEGLRMPERLVGMHFFVPAHINKFVEIVGPDKATKANVKRAAEYCQEIGKEYLVCSDTPGFVVNRFYLPLINEAARLVDEGLGTVDEVEVAACQLFGLPVGPFAVCNMGRPQTTYAAVKGLEVLGPFYHVARLVEMQGKHGGRWDITANAGASRSDFGISKRLAGAVFFAALDAVSHGVAAVSDFDLAARVALKFKRPPFELMNTFGRNAVAEMLGAFCSRYQAKMPSAIRQVSQGSSAEHVKQ